MEQRPTSHLGDPKDHLANERTFLAWIRTSVGIMAFGFVVEKFALFVKKLIYVLDHKGLSSQNFDAPLPSYSTLFGLTLIILGALIAIFSYLSYRRTTRQIEKGNYHCPFILAACVTGLVVVIAVVLSIYLMTV